MPGLREGLDFILLSSSATSLRIVLRSTVGMVPSDVPTEKWVAKFFSSAIMRAIMVRFCDAVRCLDGAFGRVEEANDAAAMQVRQVR